MNKIIFAVLFLALIGAIQAQNTFATGTLTLVAQGGGAGGEWRTYRIATGNYYKMNLLVNYTRGNSTSVTIALAYRYGDPGINPNTSYTVSYAGSGDIATTDTIIMTATAARLFPCGMSKRGDWLYVTVAYTGGTTGAVTVDVLLDYTQ